MRADRLLSILMLLQTRGRMTAHELAEQLEVSERTIYRDFEALSIAGIPLYTLQGPGGGCSLVDGYQTRLTGLTETEIRALFLSTITAPSADLGMGRALEDALLKVSAALPESSRYNVEHTRQRFYVDMAEWQYNERITAYLETIQAAIWHDQKLCINYSNDDGTHQQYFVEPYGLVVKARTWYLVGMIANMAHVFRVSRIDHVQATDLSFTRLPSFQLVTCWHEYQAQQKKRILISSAAQQQQKRHHPTHKKAKWSSQKNAFRRDIKKRPYVPLSLLNHRLQPSFSLTHLFMCNRVTTVMPVCLNTRTSFLQ